MEKYYKDDGFVAVLYSPDFGAGWYTWHGIDELVYDPVVVQMVLDEKPGTEIVTYCKDKYGSHRHFGGASDLTIRWMPPGTSFTFREYDGAEFIEYEGDQRWWVA